MELDVILNMNNVEFRKKIKCWNSRFNQGKSKGGLKMIKAIWLLSSVKTIFKTNFKFTFISR